MRNTVEEFLKAFEALPSADQHELAVAILRRTTLVKDLPESALHEIADELFQSYDAEEGNRANRQTR